MTLKSRCNPPGLQIKAPAALGSAAATLSTLIGLGVISTGAAYLFALLGITRFEKKVDGGVISVAGK